MPQLAGSPDQDLPFCFLRVVVNRLTWHTIVKTRKYIFTEYASRDTGGCDLPDRAASLTE